MALDRRALLASIAVGATATAGCLDGTRAPAAGRSATTVEEPTATRPRTASRVLTATRSPSPTETRTSSPTATPTPTAAVSIDAGPDRELTFVPRSFSVAVGGTVEWVFRSAGHNAKPTAVPEGSSWTGTPGDRFSTVPIGFISRHTFTVPGSYEYVCVPHRSLGMVGSFTVEP